MNRAAHRNRINRALDRRRPMTATEVLKLQSALVRESVGLPGDPYIAKATSPVIQRAREFLQPIIDREIARG